MLRPNDIGKVPQTPPRKVKEEISGDETKFRDDGLQQEFVNALITPVTESRKSVKVLKTPSKRVNSRDQEDDELREVPITPGFTPQHKKRNRKHQKDSISKSVHARSRLVRKPETVSPSLVELSGNKAKRIRPMSLGLQLSLAQEEVSSDETASEINCGSKSISHSGSIRNEEQMATPKGKIIDDTLVNAWYEKSLNNDFSSDEELSGYENMMLKNDILDNTHKPAKINTQQIQNPFASTPFNSNTKINIPTSPVIDYSTHAEYYNSKTGERIIRELTEDEKQIKPKKLNFKCVAEDNDQPLNETNQPSTNDSGNQETSVGNKFLLNNLNRFMVDSKPKNGLGFEIFKDHTS